MTRLAPIVIGAIAACYFALFLTYGMELEDEGLMLAQAQRTAHGQVPYLDFDTGYTPGVFYLNAALFRVFGESVVPIRIVLLGINTMTIVLIFVLARPWAGTALAAAAALGYAAFLPQFPGQFASFNIPYPSWHAGLAYIAVQAAIDRHLRRGGRLSLLVAGLLVGLAFTFKPNAGGLAAVACGLALAVPAAGDRDPNRRLARALVLLGAMALLALPFVDFELSIGNLVYNFGIIASPALALAFGRLWLARGTWARERRLGRSIAIVAAGALLPTLPWLVWFLVHLGPARFFREVLLLGAGVENLYATSFPIPLAFPGAWSLIASALVAAFAGTGFAVERKPKWLPWAALVLAIAAIGAALRLVDIARMPEGIGLSIVMQLQVVCFVATPPLLLAAVVRLLRRMRVDGDGVMLERWNATVVFAACMFLFMYPRLDSMHVITAMPPVMVVAAALAARVARAWERVLGTRRRHVVAGMTAVAFAIAAVAAGPGVVAATAPDQVALDSARLPVHVDAGRATDLRAFGRMLHFLEARLAPGDRIFGFPAMGLVSYALGRMSPVRSEYFFSGRPDHATEVRILAALVASPPRFIVTLNRRLGYFFEAPIYYFILRPFVLERYALVARAGRYDVLELRASGAAPPPPTLLDDPTMRPTTPEETFAWMGDPDRELRRAAVAHFLASAGDAAGVVDLAARWAPDERRRLLLVRNLGEHGDERALTFMAAQLEPSTSERMRDEVGSALITMVLRDRLAPYLFGGNGTSFAPDAWRQLDLPGLRARMTSRDGRLRLGIIAAHAFASADEREAIPVLEEMLSRRDELDQAPWVGTWLRVSIAEALVRLGHPERMCDLVDMLEIDKHEVQDIMPSRLIAEARRHPEEAVRCITRGLASPDAFARANSAFVGGAASLPALAPGLQAAASDTDPDVRLAVRWALARVRGETDEDALVDALAESSVAR